MKNDLISRQAAIDALFELYEYQRDIDPTEAADLVRQGIFLAEKKIEKLPSAQPGYEDAVSRKAAIDALPYLLDYEGFRGESGYVSKNLVRTMLKELPPVTPKQPGWIPTSVRLPEDNEEVLFCNNEGERWLGWHYGFWKTENLDFNEDDVLAWMPLPKPYREGGQHGEG